MPGLELYLRDTATTKGEDVSITTPEHIPLHLPSSLSSEKWPSVYISGLAEVEDRLWFAQACEALTELHCQLIKRTYASRYRTANISSQNHYTRFRELQDQTESKIKAACSKRSSQFAGKGGLGKEVARTPSRRRAWIKRESTDQRGKETRDKNKGDGGDIRLWQSV